MRFAEISVDKIIRKSNVREERETELSEFVITRGQYRLHAQLLKKQKKL